MECFSCKKSFDSTQLLSHVKDCYPEKEGSKNFLLKCNSSDCNKVFRSFNGLKLHLSSHTDHESNQENRERQIENDESEEESVDVLFKHCFGKCSCIINFTYCLFKVILFLYILTTCLFPFCIMVFSNS